MRIVLGPCLLLALLAATGCDTLGGGDAAPTSPSGPPASGSTITYAAVGASDVIGLGSTQPCLPFADCNGNGYVWVAARQLRARNYTVAIQSLGIPTAVISRTVQDVGAQYGRTDIVANLIQQEMPFITKDATLVTIFAGANDINVITSALGRGAGGSNPAAFVDQMVKTFQTDWTALIAGVRDKAPRARLIALNVPNMGAMPYMAGATLAQKQAAQRAAVAMTATVINPTPSLTVVDLMCDARLYQASMLSADGFHPNDGGYQLIGSELVNAIVSDSYPTPRSSCAQMAVF